MSTEWKWKRLVEASYFTIAVIIISFVARYGVNVLLANHLKAEAYGDYAAMINVVFFAGTVLLLGSDEAALRFIPEYVYKRDWARVSGYIKHHLKLILLISVVVVTVMFLIATVLYLLSRVGVGTFFDYHPILFAIWFAPMFALIVFQAKLLRSLHKVAWSLLTFKILPFLLMAFGIFLFTSKGSILTMYQALMVYGTGLFVVVITQFILLLAALPYEVDFSQAEYQKRKWFAVSTAIMFASLIFAGVTTVDLLLLELLGPNEAQVGILAAVLTISSGVLTMPLALNAVIAQRVRVLVRRQNHVYLQKYANICNYIIVPPIILVAIAIIVYGKALLGHFGQAFVAGYDVLIFVILILGILSMLTAFGRPLLQYSGRHRQLVYANVVALIVMVVVDIVTMPFYGIYGAVLSMILSRLIVAVWVLWASRKLLHIRAFLLI
ncbi:MAG: polysaccharide biosynthesis C-terminal domain-containing protein [Gammaproteobacteria bacterium]|nr:polysaccharide biosynthesis C-terminal domain-containing protein [Gammaproteobacteria bacterium]